MATAVSICSNALLELGAQAIASFDDGNDRARLCANVYPTRRDALLRAHPWNCAVRRVQLSPLAERPPWGYAHAYPLPPDWLRTLKVGGWGDYTPDFRHEGRQLLAGRGIGSGSALLLRYIARVDEGEWDAALVGVMTACMKWALAYPITKSTSLRAEMRDEYVRLLREAKSIDSMDEPGEQIAEASPLLAARY